MEAKEQEKTDLSPEQLAQLEKQKKKQEYMFRWETSERIVRYLDNQHPPEEYFCIPVPKCLSLMGLLVSAILFVFYNLFGVAIGLAWAETNSSLVTIPG